MKGVDILIRGIDSAAITIIDERAKELKCSRNEYLQNLLQEDAKAHLTTSARQDMDHSLNRVANALEVISNKVNQSELNYQKIVVLVSLLTGIDVHELNTVVNQTVVEKEDGKGERDS